MKITKDHAIYGAKLIGGALVGAACGWLFATAVHADTFDDKLDFVAVRESQPLKDKWYLDEHMMVKGGQQIGIACSGYAMFRGAEGGTVIRFNALKWFKGNERAFGITVAREGWKVTKNKEYAMHMGFNKDPDRVKLHSIGVRLWQKYDGVMATWSSDELRAQGVVQQFIAKSNTMEIIINSTQVGSFGMSGSANMLAELNKCADGGETF